MSEADSEWTEGHDEEKPEWKDFLDLMLDRSNGSKGIKQVQYQSKVNMQRGEDDVLIPADDTWSEVRIIVEFK